MKKVIVAAIATLSIAQSVHASPGADMQAAIMGLPAGEYTLSELLVIQEARRESDVGTEQFYIKKLNRVPVSEEARDLAREVAENTSDNDMMMMDMGASNGGMMNDMGM